MRCLLALVLIAACGPTSKTLREAHESSYDVGFPEVWNVVTEEVRRKYPQVSIEDPIRGHVLSGWRVIEIGEGEGQTSSGATAYNQQRTESGSRVAPGQVSNMAVPARLFRITVDVKGLGKGGPWRVRVDGEAAEYEPGMAVLKPFRHGQPDEPPWVSSRIDALTVAIHDRLKKYATKDVPKAEIAGPVAEPTADPWANLPDRAVVDVIGTVYKAAAARNAGALRPAMSDDFAFSGGAEGSAETAVALFYADPTKLRQLAAALQAGCGAEADSGDVVCPAKAAGAQARFRKASNGWKFVAFTTE